MQVTVYEKRLVLYFWKQDGSHQYEFMVGLTPYQYDFKNMSKKCDMKNIHI